MLKGVSYLTQFAKLHICFQFPKAYVRLETRRKGHIKFIAVPAEVPSSDYTSLLLANALFAN